MVLSSASVNVHIHAQGSPTGVDVQVFDPATDVSELLFRSRVLRVGRSQVFTEVRIEDAADERRVIGQGTTSFVVTGAAEPQHPAYGQPVAHGEHLAVAGGAAAAHRGVCRGAAGRRRVRGAGERRGGDRGRTPALRFHADTR
jgi:hypothetical protein